jgi:type I restriction enzyme, R subunit
MAETIENNVRVELIIDEMAVNPKYYEKMSELLDEADRSTKKDDWRGSRIKEREVRYVIRQYLNDEDEIQRF